MNHSNAHLYLPLVQALVDGKTIQHLDGYGIWNDTAKPIFSKSPDAYRIKPWTLTRHLPGFRPLRDGEEWHRQDFTEEMLPEGWRPLLLGQNSHQQDDYYPDGVGPWRKVMGLFGISAGSNSWWVRTRRPLPEPPKPVPLEPADIWPGDAIRQNDEDPGWAIIVSVGYHGVDLCGIPTAKFYSFQKLCDGGYQILHRGQSTWFPCHKLP